MPSNKDRIESATTAIEAHLSATGYSPGDVRDDFVDLVANLLHYAKAKRIDIDDALRMAKLHFEAET
jgi:hypothetical protein